MSVVSVNEYWENEAKKGKPKNPIDVRYATVIGLTLQGEPIIQFMGDSLPSKKTYKRLKHYIPEVGDRIMLINKIIQGGWKI